ncbi:DUF222 domain-containing protein [Mycobacterium koreense]|uniref:HNH endonuclease n=1 Tax=Mycolicibacillus koreensis TaxID=1069220 RepID=A0A7I7SK94_9MYCO|nr:HNH endonuclease signature motif containing protein [Mycolicibacillus koreensis]MCV7246698.1 DUF222 domain-containing protein [Mycolicibacillus koreensis]ODR04520.1 hypothetical protein BHQ15_16910 [Mycolicibacillus koreensis]OSC30305.1 HNH endonuclease [Mycolicibacillus koreensis]BBY56356.1 hypothetical protein MKOR_36070 [Mycolicibacillus koreensis]
MFDTKESSAAKILDRVTAGARAENRGAGTRLAAIGDLDTLRSREHAERELWTIDNAAATVAEVAAALGIERGLAANYLWDARALRDRLPKVGALLCSGEISALTFHILVYRTDLITDPEIMAAVDTALAERIPRCPRLTRHRLCGLIDAIIARADRDAVRRRREHHTDRHIVITPFIGGGAEIHGQVTAVAGHALDARLDALAATVCEHDPRTRDQRRADAITALAAAADRMACHCGRPDCPVSRRPAASPVLIHVIADQGALAGGAATASVVGSDAIIPPELLAELAREARTRTLHHPADSPPEAGYTPSRALADFVRCRDLTCRFPGCDVPATECDIDHVVPYRNGGTTHASNLSCKCRTHHLLKTFLAWRDRQLPDGTLIWTAPSGQTYVTLPGSALLFPNLCAPTGELAPPPPPTADPSPTDRTLKMPTRRHTRAEGHARYVAAERRRNRARRLAQPPPIDPWAGTAPDYDDGSDPPPF